MPLRKKTYKCDKLSVYLNINNYILGVFTEKPNSKGFECNVVYIPVTTSGHTTSVTSK